MKKSVCFVAMLILTVAVLLASINFGSGITSQAISEVCDGGRLFVPLVLIGLLVCLGIFIAVLNNSRN